MAYIKVTAIKAANKYGPSASVWYDVKMFEMNVG